MPAAAGLKALLRGGLKAAALLGDLGHRFLIPHGAARWILAPGAHRPQWTGACWPAWLRRRLPRLSGGSLNSKLKAARPAASSGGDLLP